MQKVNLVLAEGKESSVNKDELRFLLTTKRVVFFQRSSGLIICGHGKLRSETISYSGENRRDYDILPRMNSYNSSFI